MPKRLAMVLTVLFTVGVGSMLGQATLPVDFSFANGRSSLPTGVSQSGLGTDYAASNAPYRLKFDTNGDYIQVEVDGAADKITIGVKQYATTAPQILIQGSVDGSNYTDIETISISVGQNNTAERSSTQSISSTYRYFRIKRSSGGNFGLGTLTISKAAASDPHIVTLVPGSGSVADTKLKEKSAGAGVTLPKPTLNGCDEWSFAGWAEQNVEEETNEEPILIPAGTYNPAKDITLYAVYQRTEDGSGGNTTGSKTFTLSTIASANSWENGVAYTSIKDDPVTIVAEGDGNNGKWYTSGNGSWRMYSGGTVRIAADGGIITSVTSTPSCTFTINNGEATFSPSARTDFTKFVVEYSVAGGSTTYYHSTPDCGTSVPTYTLTNSVSPVGYGTVSPSSVAGIPEGTTTTSSSNTYTVNGTTVTATPTTATAQYTYAFSKWQDLPATVNGNTTVTAVFTRTTNKYTITWKNGDNVLETDNNVEYGVIPQYNGATPTKAATAQYTYAFTGWNPAIASVTKDQTYTAQFSQTVNKYTITWKNADGTTLKTEEVAYGTTPSYTGTIPTKAATEQYTYTHNGWTPSVVAVTGNAEYTATFAETPRTYTITLNTNGGTINAGNVTSYKYGVGATLPTNVTKENHQFGGWFDNSGCTGTAVTVISTTATGNKEYWAKWTELPKYIVTWSVDGNTTTEEVYSGKKPTGAPTIDPNNLPCEGADKFVGWTDAENGNYTHGTSKLYKTIGEIPAITGNITFYAVFADYAD